MSDSTSQPRLKQCSRKDQCIHPDGPWLPETEFSNYSRSKDGLAYECKRCKAERTAEWRKKYPEKQAKLNREKRERWSSDPEYRKLKRQYDRQYRADHPDLDKEKYWRDPEKYRKQRRDRYAADPEPTRAANKKWHQANTDYHRRKYRQNPKYFILKVQRRETRKRQLPNTFTQADYEMMMAYWGSVCAISGETGDLHLDHWIPLSNPDCPGTVPTNIVPLSAGLNASKHNHDPYTWLATKFGDSEAQEIARRIERYFEWVRLQKP